MQVTSQFTLLYYQKTKSHKKAKNQMDRENQALEPRKSSSIGRLSRESSSSRRHSLQKNETFDENESVSEAGDIGDRALHSNRFSFDSFANNEVVSIDEVAPSQGNKDELKEVHWLFEYVTCLVSLAVFGILGVLVRYCLQKLFGPDLVGATSDHSYMYLDLPSNMVGSFLMGWLGVVFKPDISQISDQLAIGLTTGFLGSLTTFSAWSQKMLDLSIEGRWVFSLLGILLGLFLVAYSIIFGIETAKGFKWLLTKSDMRSLYGTKTCCHSSYISNVTFMVMLLVMLVLLWGLFGSLAGKEFESGGNGPELFLACTVGPFGVWARWFMARFNGRGLGKKGVVKWMPFGTLAANVLAACVMAALATLKKAVNTKNCDTVASGIQFGLLGCLSTVSTFIAEFNAMRESDYPWRAYAYATITFLTSFVLGTLIYSVPVWAKRYN
ncbi:camphor resistance CrcB family protein [Striga asiatica]|uniref:Camphor resistance CrcB family protein n=1 Tax=Striga asiatica TaxID=4170 RepID=A0A5A7QW59_STRAF|nr:camphor resistance CrcB family protein [Striga asiatica]